MANRTKWTLAKAGKFIEFLKSTPNVLEAARSVGMSSSRVYELKKEDKEFSISWDAAIDIGLQNMEQVLLDRVLNGVEEGIIEDGKVVKGRVRHSDALMMFLMKAHNPKKYRERHEITGANGAPLVPTLTVTVASGG